jgi:hypothetical protein
VIAAPYSIKVMASAIARRSSADRLSNRGGSYDYFSQSCTGVLAASLEDAWLAWKLAR